jgi:DNA invertase Pin-like site-specific DNA recombinase
VLASILEFIRPGDELVVVKRDRLGRATRDVLNLVHELEQKGGGLRVLEPEFCTSTDTGRILVTVLGMVAEMERRFILDRQRAGIEAAKKRGAYKGRKPSMPVETVRKMHVEGKGPAEIAAALGVSRMSVWRALNGGHSGADGRWFENASPRSQVRADTAEPPVVETRGPIFWDPCDLPRGRSCPPRFSSRVFPANSWPTATSFAPISRAKMSK